MRTRLPWLFKFHSRLVLLGWACLFFFPLWPYSRPFIFSLIALLCATYTYLIWVEGKWDSREDKRKVSFKGFLSLSGVVRMFEVPRVVLAGWLHFLAFDLFVGVFIVMDAHQQGIPHLFILPVLFFTLMLGPFGLLLYMALRLGLTLFGY